MILIVYLFMLLAGCQETHPQVRAQSTPIPPIEETTPELEPKRHRVEIGAPKPPPDKTVDERLNLLEGQINWMKKRLKY